MLRRALVQASRNGVALGVLRRAPGREALARRLVAGPEPEDAVRVAAAVVAEGLAVSIDYLGAERGRSDDPRHAAEACERQFTLLALLAEADLTGDPRVEISIRMPALGLDVPDGGREVAADHARRICRTALAAGTAVVLDGVDPEGADAALSLARELREDGQEVGVALQARMRRTEVDCARLAAEGVRVRLGTGSRPVPGTLAYPPGLEADLSFVRSLRSLMAGSGQPVVATNDPRLVDLAGALAVQWSRSPGSYEFQIPFGVQPVLQRQLAERGESVRVHLPFGGAWYGYVVRRLAERPASAPSILRGPGSPGAGGSTSKG